MHSGNGSGWIKKTGKISFDEPIKSVSQVGSNAILTGSQVSKERTVVKKYLMNIFYYSIRYSKGRLTVHQ